MCRKAWRWGGLILILASHACAHSTTVGLMPAAPPALVLRVDPRVCLEFHCSIRVRVRIEPHPDNRFFAVIIDDGASMYSENVWELEGDRAPRTQPDQWYAAAWPGLYQVTALLYRVGSTEPYESASFTVQIGVTAAAAVGNAAVVSGEHRRSYCT